MENFLLEALVVRWQIRSEFTRSRKTVVIVAGELFLAGVTTGNLLSDWIIVSFFLLYIPVTVFQIFRTIWLCMITKGYALSETIELLISLTASIITTWLFYWNPAETSIFSNHR